MPRLRAWIYLVLSTLFVLGEGAIANASGVPVMGTVVEPATAATGVGVTPSGGATVTFQVQGKSGASKQIVTGLQGSFIFESVPEGDVTFTASKPGFGSASKQVRVYMPGPVQVLLFLQPPGRSSSSRPPSASGSQYPPAPYPASSHSDTVYVAFASSMSAQPGPNGQPNYSNTILAGPPQTNRASLGALLYGADPFSFGGNAPMMNTGPGSYQTNTSAAANTIMVFNPDQPTRTAYVDTPVRSFWLAFNANGSKLFAATDQQTVNVYDTSNNNAMVAQIPAGGIVTDLVRVGNYIYASVMGNSPGVLVIDGARAAAVRVIPVRSGGQPRSVTATIDGRVVFVALDNGGPAGQVVALDSTNDRVLGAGHVGAAPLGIALSPDNLWLLVTNSKSASVSLLDASTLAEKARLPVGMQPVRVAIRPDGRKAYVTCKGDNTVSVIHLRQVAVGSRIPVGPGPMGIAVGPSGTVYVSCNGNGTLSIIDGNSDSATRNTSPLPRGSPYGVAVKP